jgi:hypothetical protein
MEEPSTLNHQPGEMPRYSQPVPANLPNATSVLVLGILSIVFCCYYFFSFIGVILGIIALALASKDMKLYAAGPEKYSLSSYNNLKAGRTCAIIGVVVSFAIFVIFMLVLFGLLATMPFWGMID